MQISHSNQYSPQFKALHIANVGDLKLYKITDQADKNFLNKLAKEIKTQNLMPNINQAKTNKWDEILKYAVECAQFPDSVTYIETLNNKPCGIISFTLEKGISTLDAICTWPIEIGKKVHLAGKALFYQLFKDFQEFKGDKLYLDAIIDGPYNVVKKYEELGFENTKKMFQNEILMKTDSNIIKEMLKKLSSIIDYKQVDPKNVNLRELDL